MARPLPAQFPKWDRCKNTKKHPTNCCPNTTVLNEQYRPSLRYGKYPERYDKYCPRYDKSAQRYDKSEAWSWSS
jgi:hypothetical protein